MKVIKGYKYRCYPTPRQETVLNGMMGARRVYWNLVLDMYNDIYEHNKTVEDEDKVKNYDFCTDSQSQRPNNDFYHVDKVIEHYKNKSGGERDYSWLKNYNSTIFVCVLSDLDDAMKTFFKNRNKGNKVGVPTHKKKRDSNSVRLKDANTLRFVDGHILWDENKVITAGFKQTGSIRCKLHRRFNGIIKETTFSRDIDGKWYVSFSVEEQVEDVNPPTHVDPSNVLGIDLGLKTALVTANAVDGDDNHENINKGKFEKELHNLQSKIHRIQRAMTRCIVTMTREGAESKSMTVKEMNKCEQENKHAFSGYHKNYSGGYFRLLEWKRKLESHIRRKREYDNHKLTYDIVERPDVLLIGMETLGVKEMMARDKTKKELGIKVKAENGPIRKPRRKMAKHFGDLALSDISRMLEYKALQRGKGFCKVDRYFASSKICSHCGYKNTELTLGDRKWVCPQCGAEINRDGNAAKNIAKKALEIYNEKQSAQT